MDSLIGKLRVALQLDSAAFETGAKRAAAEVNTFGSKAEQAGFKVGQMSKALVAGGTAFAASAIVQQLKNAVVGALEYASSLSEAAQQMGVTVEALQQFRLLAEQSGVAEDTMDKALQKLTRSMGDAAAGGKKQSTAFDQLGISIRDTSGHMKTADQILPEIAGALAKIENPAQRATYEVALFGKSGQDLEPLLGQGEQAIRDFMAQASAAGIIISKDLADKADSAADKITFLQKKLGMKFTVAVAEHADEIDRIVTSLSNLVDKFFALINVMDRFANSPGGKLLGQLNRAASLTNPLGLAGEIAGQIPTGQGGAAPAAGAGARPAPGVWNGSKLGGPMRPGGAFSPGAGPLSRFANDNSPFGSTGSTLAGMAPGLRAPAFETLFYLPEAMQNSFAEVTKTTTEAADDADLQTVRIARSFKDMADQTVSALSNMSSSIKSGDFLSILGSAVGLITQLGSIGLFGKSMATRLNSIPAHANGTNFAPGGLSLVGERGPELVNLPRGSKVYPNGTGPGGGGNTYVLKGNLMTPEFWAMIQQGNVAAAQAGGDIGFGKVARSQSRAVNW